MLAIHITNEGIMNEQQEVQIDEVVEIRELSEAEVLAVAGGPQVTNDQPLA